MQECQLAWAAVTECLHPDSESGGLPSAKDWVGMLLTRFVSGHCRLPVWMGLDEARFQALCDEWGVTVEFDETQQSRQQLLDELLCARLQERDELDNWLRGHVVPGIPEMPTLIATASMGFNHLWEDLGLDSRAQLRELMTACFPELVLMNDLNLRWKKFFYRQLCAAGGNYLCRAPSCHVCYERAQCMAPEEGRLSG